MAAAGISLVGFLARPAAAADVLTFAVGGSVIRDTNLFRLPDSANPPFGKASRADTIRIGYGGLRIDKLYAQQRFQFDVTETLTRHANFSRLDFDGLDHRSAWLWHLTPRLSGTLSADHKEAPALFADVPGNQRNVRTTDTRIFSLDAWAFGGWHLVGEVSKKELKSEVPSLAENDFRIVSAGTGVKYAAASANSITISQYSRRGDYQNRAVDAATLLDNNFREQESELKFNWSPSGSSTVKGRLAWLERRHEHFAQRDFSGLVGELSDGWIPTGNLRLDVSASRDITAMSQLFSSYRVNDTLSFKPSWQTSAKSTVRFLFTQVTSNFRGPVVALPEPLRRDITRTAMLSGEWTPRNSITLSAGVQRQARTSNDPAFEYHTTIVNISAVLSF